MNSLGIKLHLPIPHVPKEHVCPWLLTIGLFGIAACHECAPDYEARMALIVGIAWAWSRPE